MPRRTDPDWLTARDAAELLGVARSTFYRLIDAGDLAHIRTYQPGRHKLYYRPDLLRYKADRGGLIDDK